MEKVYISTKETIWNEIVSANITEEENLILNSEDNSLKDLKFKTLLDIKSRQTLNLNKEDLIKIQSNYSELKKSLNILKEDTYKLISITMIIKDDTSYSGVLNYIINDKHNQLRF